MENRTFKSKEELKEEFYPKGSHPKDDHDFQINVNVCSAIEKAFQSFAERVETYRKYRNDKKAFKKAFPEIHMGFKGLVAETDEPMSYFRFYREFLFEFCFGDIIVGGK